MLLGAVVSISLWCLRPAYGETPSKVMVLAWDGTVPSFVEEMLRAGKLPNLAKLIAGGAMANDVMPGFPSKTAPGFASLMTGAPPRVTGISGNRVPREPRAEYTILDSLPGFSAAPLRAEPIWVPAHRAGKKVVISHVPSFAQEQSENAIRFHGYDMIAGREGVVTPRVTKPEPAIGWIELPPSEAPPLEIGFTVGASKFFGLLIDDPADLQAGYDTLVLNSSRTGTNVQARLKANPSGPGGELFWSRPIHIKTADGGQASAYFRLFELRGDGSDFFLYFTRPSTAQFSHPELLEESGATVGAFIGNGASILYHQGSFGRTIPNGGSGAAEFRYIETVSFAQNQLIETNRWSLEHLPWDLYLAYTPFPDEAEHLWRGYLDPKLSTYNPEIAERLRPFLERVYQTSDEHLGVFLMQRPADALIALISDHGMQGVNKRVAINEILREAGLLVLNEQGRVDLARTKVLYPAINNGYLLINSTDRQSGIVPAGDRPAIAEHIRELLMAIHDGDREVVKAVYDAETQGVEMGIGGASGGDIYIELAYGYDFDARLKPGPLISRVEPYGTHGSNPQQPSMRTLMIFNGPEIISGQRLQNVQIIDFAPTLSALFNLPAPRNSVGRVLEELTQPR